MADIFKAKSSRTHQWDSPLSAWHSLNFSLPPRLQSRPSVPWEPPADSRPHPEGEQRHARAGPRLRLRAGQPGGAGGGECDAALQLHPTLPCQHRTRSPGQARHGQAGRPQCGHDAGQAPRVRGESPTLDTGHLYTWQHVTHWTLSLHTWKYVTPSMQRENTWLTVHSLYTRENTWQTVYT